ncbi:hypothetical protein JL49_20735 [Pseudoalteromonas luteoviolacea]|nr:hypothetical protein JL49_20735 [Pseudoalteromonas luteoviolacea]
MNIYGNKVKLRAIEKEDNAFLLEMINSAELEYWVVGSSVPTSSIQQGNWIDKVENSQNAIRLVVEELEGGPIGFANIVQIDQVNRSAVHGVKFASDFRGKGFAKDTVRAVMKYAFETLNLNRLESTILEYNEASIGLYTKACGWSIEGVKKQAVYKNGKYNDLVLIGITRQDYEQMQQS